MRPEMGKGCQETRPTPLATLAAIGSAGSRLRHYIPVVKGQTLRVRAVTVPLPRPRETRQVAREGWGSRTSGNGLPGHVRVLKSADVTVTVHGCWCASFAASGGSAPRSGSGSGWRWGWQGLFVKSKSKGVGVLIEFQVGTKRCEVSEEDAVRLASHLLDRETVPAARVAVRVMRALQEQVLDAA